MRHSIPIKFIAIMLTALALVAAFVSALGIMQVVELGLYTDGFDSWVRNRLEWQAYDLARNLTDRYGVRTLTNCPDELLSQLGYWYIFDDSIHWTGLDESAYDFTITDENGKKIAHGNGLPESVTHAFSYQAELSIDFPVMVTDKDVIDAEFGEDYMRQETVYADIYDDKPVAVRYYESEKFTVSIELDPDAAMDRAGTSLALIQLVYAQRYNLMFVLAASLIILAAGLVYLCCAAGKIYTKDAPNPTGLNRLPLDVYAGGGTVAVYFLVVLAAQMINYWIFGTDNLNPGTLVLTGLVLLAIALIGVGFYFALCAQIKTKNLYWLRNALLVRLVMVCWKGILWLFRKLNHLLQQLPLIWQWVLTGGAMVCFPLLFLFFLAANVEGESIWTVCLLLSLLADVILVCYGAYAYGALLSGAKRMAEGNLHAKISTHFLVGPFARFAAHLNALADVAVIAAEKQLRSERMKTELITNVSHDIKTPLTSIINYIDLLEKPHTEPEGRQYLEVLGRQSQRMKKLIEDLMEMSKASSGNIPVHIQRIDAAETVNQALGEFSDKLEAAGLIPVFQQPEAAVPMLADGRLAWRVLSNLLSNVVKYALPGTRVYADISALPGQVQISLKNISRDPLNISADELTERFVRGDTSRNTEGSGLGLNIAKSLMDLQKGQLELVVDGDLFKVTLIFPAES